MDAVKIAMKDSLFRSIELYEGDKEAWVQELCRLAGVSGSYAERYAASMIYTVRIKIRNAKSDYTRRCKDKAQLATRARKLEDVNVMGTGV